MNDELRFENQPLSLEDKQIVRQLQADGRTTKRALAALVGLAPSTTLDRVRALEHRGVIKGYHARVSLEALGRPLQALVAIRISPKTETIVNALVAQLQGLAETQEVFVLGGETDVLAHLAVADAKELQRVILDNVANVPGVVDTTTSLVFEHRSNSVEPHSAPT